MLSFFGSDRKALAPRWRVESGYNGREKPSTLNFPAGEITRGGRASFTRRIRRPAPSIAGL
jgi:hypothetical protein